MMSHEFDFLKYFPKNQEGLYIVYELFTFDNLFRLLMANWDLNHDDALDFMISNCSFSAIIFQERIHNKNYYSLDTKDVLPPNEAAVRAKLISDLLDCTIN